MRSRVFRCLVCLLVAAVMIVNLSPLYVHATSTAVTAAVVGVGILVATAIAFQALGVRQGSDPTAFQTLVSECSSALSADWAVNGLVNMLAVNDGILTKTYASQNFMQSVLDWIFGTGTLSYTEEYWYDGLKHQVIMDAYNTAMSYPYHCVGTLANANYCYFYGSDSPIEVRYNNSVGTYLICATDTTVYGWEAFATGTCSSFTIRPGSGRGSLIAVYDSCLVSEITTTADLTLESVGTDIETDYDTYVDEGIISVDFGIQFEDDPNTGRNEDDDNNAFWLPAAIPGLNEGIYTDQSQADAQSGLTDPDIIQQLLDAMNGSGNGSGTGSDNTNSSWNPPSDHNQFALGDLSKFFLSAFRLIFLTFLLCLTRILSLRCSPGRSRI